MKHPLPLVALLSLSLSSPALAGGKHFACAMDMVTGDLRVE